MHEPASKKIVVVSWVLGGVEELLFVTVFYHYGVSIYPVGQFVRALIAQW